MRPRESRCSPLLLMTDGLLATLFCIPLRWSPARWRWYHWLQREDRKSTRLNSSHVAISYAVFCLKKKKKNNIRTCYLRTHCAATKQIGTKCNLSWDRLNEIHYR